MIHIQLYEYFEMINYSEKSRFGFRKQISTIDFLTNEILITLENKSVLKAILCYLSKA